MHCDGAMKSTNSKQATAEVEDIWKSQQPSKIQSTLFLAWAGTSVACTVTTHLAASKWSRQWRHHHWASSCCIPSEVSRNAHKHTNSWSKYTFRTDSSQGAIFYPAYYRSFGYWKLSQYQYVFLFRWSGTVATVLRLLTSVVRKYISPSKFLPLYSSHCVTEIYRYMS